MGRSKRYKIKIDERIFEKIEILDIFSIFGS